MDKPIHGMSALFDQLGLDSGDAAIEAFIAEHRPLASGTSLADASFWSEGQAAFLREELREDADWAAVVDQLNVALRG